MSYRDFDEFLIRLEQDDHVVSASVRAEKIFVDKRGPAPVTVYTDPASNAKCVRHAFASSQRIAWALRAADVNEVAARLERLLDLSRPHSFPTMMDRASDLMSSLKIIPGVGRKSRSLPPIVDPAHVSSALAGLGSMVVGTVYVDRDHGTYWGIQASATAGEAMRVRSPRRLGLGERVVITLGGDPAALIAALMPLPKSVHRSYVSGWLRKRPQDMMRLDDRAVEVPANVEGVVFGTVAKVECMPTVDTSAQGRYDVQIDIEHARLRSDPVFVSLSDADVDALRHAMLRISLPLVRIAVPELRDIRCCGDTAVLVVNGDPAAALRSAYSFLASPFGEGVRTIVAACGDSDSHAIASKLTKGSVQRFAATSPDTGALLPVFVVDTETVRTVNSAEELAEYDRVIVAWLEAGGRLEE